MDLYQVLSVSINASQREIEHAYQRLLKEARYNSQINRQDIELAYRVLGNPTQKAAYDKKLDQTSKLSAIGAALRRKKGKAGKQSYSARQLVRIALVLLVVAAIYFLIRFGYQLKDFSQGDVIYLKETNQRVGVIVQVEDDHLFAEAHRKRDAYLVRTPEEERWIPANMVKAYCYKLQ